MKIECDKCGAKYSIADDKVRGKTFKIRCKKCSNVIIVRDKAGAEDGGDAPAEEPGWHLAIGGETVGPISEAEVRERFAAGEIDKETSVWQEGFDDWLPLGEVTTFTDLADRPAAGGHAAAATPAPDPFAGGGDEDYSAPSSSPSPSSGADYGHEPEPAHMPAAAQPESGSTLGGANPRVSALTGARNENSVLFSLDSLSSMAMGKPGGGGGGGGGAPSPGPSFSLGGGGGGGGGAPAASPTGNSEGSGLIDIRAMSGMMGGGGGGGGGGAGGGDDSRDDSMLPSFGGTGFGGLSAAPLLVTPATPVVEQAPAPEPQRSSNTPLYVMMVIFLIGMGGMAWYILTRPPPTPETKIVEVIKSVPVQNEDQDEDKPRKKKKEEEGEDEGEDEGDPEDTPAGTDSKKTASKTASKTTAKKTDKTGDKAPAVEPKAEVKKEVKKEEKKDDYSVDCILDPSKCGAKKGGDSGASKPPVDSSLPEKLELSDIQAGVNPVKATAKSVCGKLAKGGEKVTIKMSISGPAGTVLSSSAVDAAGNDALAKCVAAELKKATFKKVQKAQIGTQVSVAF